MKKLFLMLMLTVSTQTFAGVCENSVVHIEDPSIKISMLTACLEGEINSTDVLSEVTTMDPTKIEEIALAYGTAVSTIASEVGVATNEFIQTDAGRLAVWVIIYTVFGDDIKAIVFTPLICIILFLGYRHIVQKLIGYKLLVNSPKGSKSTQQYTEWKDFSEGQSFIYIILSVVMLLSCVLILCKAYL